jgi:hypothetical protein
MMIVNHSILHPHFFSSFTKTIKTAKVFERRGRTRGGKGEEKGGGKGGGGERQEE